MAIESGSNSTFIFGFMVLELVSKEDAVANNSYSYIRRGKNRRCFRCGKKGIDIEIVYYRSLRHKKLHRHFLCEDCKKLYDDDLK